jgi:C4-dicarboxylate-specific signal transduction histidine kinase
MTTMKKMTKAQLQDRVAELEKYLRAKENHTCGLESQINAFRERDERKTEYVKFLEKENRELKIRREYLSDRLSLANLKVEANQAFMDENEQFIRGVFENDACHRIFLKKDIVINEQQRMREELEMKLKLRDAELLKYKKKEEESAKLREEHGCPQQ